MAALVEGGSNDPEKRIEPPTSGSASELEDSTTVAVNERALLRKLDVKLLPAVGILYLLSFLDRSNGTPNALDRLRLANN